MNAFSNVQQEVIARLTATVADIPSLVPANGKINWITEDIGDLANIIGKTIGTLGIIGIVMTPGGGKLFNMGVYPISLVCPIEIQIQENVTVNRGAAGTQITNLDLVQFCLRRLHLWSPSNQRVNRIEVDETPYILVSEYPILTYNVRFNIGLTIT
jgi:hypothetical protein